MGKAFPLPAKYHKGAFYKDGMENQKYFINCPVCDHLGMSNRKLNDHGVAVLKENEFIYQRCIRHSSDPVTQHEKDTLDSSEY
jgi:hypothetical protein